MPGSVHYVDSVDRILNDKLGERLSILDISNTAGKGVVNETPVFLKAYNSKLTKGGGVVHVPGVVGTGYKFTTPLELTGSGPIEFIGEGRASKIFRGASLAAGKGMFNLVGAKNITFRRLLFDGATTTPVGLTYASFGEDPAHASLTTNSMFWLHGGEDITFIDCDFEHSGGYAAYLDARAAYVRRIKFINCRFRNNRPHLFGISGADMNYGSWTGGIFGQNQATGGSVFKVEDLRVTGCQFERNTGNCVWEHGYGFDSFHQRIHVDHNSFLDCGLDGILFGNVVGGSCIGNSFRRIGYICTDDTSVSVPKWLTNKNATALDTSGLVKLVPYQDNTFLSINGGAINGDGYCYGTISGNTMRVPNSSHPEYDEDRIGTTFGPGGTGANWSQGIVLGNSADGEGGIGVTISGNLFDNLGGTAIGLYGARKCQAVGNLIIVPSTANQHPITIGGFGTAPNQRATDNLITENTIHYSPATAAPAIFEDPTYRAFVPADINRVFNNPIIGNTNVFEFQKDPNTDSHTSLHFTTMASVNYQHRHGIVREGKQSDSSSVLRFYAQDGGAFGFLHMQLQMYRNPGVRGPLLNVAEYGPGITDQGGVITTGNVTTAPFGNAMITGKLNATGFIALTNSTFLDAEANLLDDNWAMLRWENTSNQWEQSISTSLGARVWTPFSGGGAGTPAPPLKSVQFNNSGAFGGSANFTWDNALRLATIITTSANPGLDVRGGFVQSAQGFLAVASTAVTYNAIQAPGGGLLGKGVHLTEYALWDYNAALAPVSGEDFTDKLMLFADGLSSHLRLVKGSGPGTYADWSLQCLGLYGTADRYNTVYAPSGGFAGKAVTVTSHAVFAPVITPTLLVGEDYFNNVLLFYDNTPDRFRVTKGTGSSTYTNHDLELRNLYASGTASNAIQVPGGGVTGLTANFTHNDRLTVNVPNGGVAARWVTVNELLSLKQLTPAVGYPPVSDLGEVRIYADIDDLLYISTDGAPYGPFGAGAGSPALPVGSVQWNNSGAFGGSANFTWNNTSQLLAVSAVAGTAGIDVAGGFIQSAQGFLAVAGSATTYNAIQAPGGGVLAQSVNATEYLAFSDPISSIAITGDSFAGKSIFRQAPGSGGWMELHYNALGTKGALALGTLDASVGVSTLFVSTTGNASTDHWVVYGLGGHNYAWRTDATAFMGLLSYNYGVYLLTMHPSSTAIEAQINTPGYFRSSGGLVFVQQSAAPALSTGGHVRLYAATDNQLYISIAGAAYTPFGGGGGATSPAGGNTMIQWNNGGVFGAAAELYYDNANKILGLWGYTQINATTNPVMIVMNRVFSPNHIYYIGVDGAQQWYVQSATAGPGFPVLLTLTPNGTPSACMASTVGWFRGDNGVGFVEQSTIPPLSGTGEVRLYAGTDHALHISTNGMPYVLFGGGTTNPAGADTQVQYNDGGVFGATANFVWSTAYTRIEVIGAIQTRSDGDEQHWIMHRAATPAYIYQIGVDSLARWLVRDLVTGVTDLAITPNAAGDSVLVECPGTVRSLNFSATGTSFSSILVGSGGVDAKWVTLKESLIFDGLASPPTNLSTGVQTRLYASSTGVLYKSSLGSAWTALSGGSGTPGGANTDVQFNKAGVFGGDGDFTFSEAIPSPYTPALLNLWGYLRFDMTGGRSWQMSSQSGTGQTAQFWIRDETWNHNVLQLVPSSTSGSPHLVFVYTPGYFQANYGFNASNSDFNAFRSTGGGGISVNCVRAAYYTHIGLAGSTPGMMTGDGLSYGCMYYNTADNTLKLYTNSGWKTVTVT